MPHTPYLFLPDALAPLPHSILHLNNDPSLTSSLVNTSVRRFTIDKATLPLTSLPLSRQVPGRWNLPHHTCDQPHNPRNLPRPYSPLHLRLHQLAGHKSPHLPPQTSSRPSLIYLANQTRTKRVKRTPNATLSVPTLMKTSVMQLPHATSIVSAKTPGSLPH